MSDCIFCKIANGEIPSDFLFEDDNVVAFRDLNPQAPVHVLVVPKEHYANLFEMPEELAADAMKLAKRIAELQKNRLHADGLNLVQNNGASAGQTVEHFHIHLIPRYENDGQTIGWKPGEPSGEELEEIRRELTED